MTFIELARKLAQESGTVGGLGLPVTVAGQSDRLQKIVDWINDAYRDIQRRRPDWLWMERAFSGPTLAGLREYSAAGLGVTRVGKWITSKTLSVQLASDPDSSEFRLVHRPFDWLSEYRITGAGRTLEGRPSEWSVDGQENIVFHPIPDDIYTVRGWYRLSPQVLAVDNDTPEMPEAYHDAIWLLGLDYLGVDDVAAEQVPEWRSRLQAIMARLESEQLPQINTRREPLTSFSRYGWGY